ncbi:MAG: WD40 repeat protein [Planctomycetota bacterium]
MSDERERYARIHEILSSVEELTGEERNQQLAAQCGDDPALRKQIEKLLEAGADGATKDLFSDGSMARSRQAIERAVDGAVENELGDATSTWLPDHIGGYDIVRQIGQGGMGIVYEAMQQFPRRSVAIKLLHPIHATANRLRRFRREAELLGRLQHPGIAQIFAASTYDIGRGPQPFFAMELVVGVDIRTYCERNGLGHRARIALLATVADAVQYAHDRGVIHRDLKPDNVLVNEFGQPRILDFGVARTTDGTVSASTLLTEQGQLIGTLAYMAPEQLHQSGDALTEQVDVYGLGVLGFELLTNRLPRNVDGLPTAEAMKRLTDTDVERAGIVDPSLAGDVETMLGKALESSLDRRYASAADFASDLRRFLGSQPIQARPPSRVYLVRKFARRNRALVGGVAATLLAAIAGAIIALGYAHDATHRAEELERLLYRSAIGAAGSSIHMRDLVMAEAHLDAVPAVHRGWEYDYLRACLVQHAEEWEAPATVLTEPLFDRERGQMFAVMADASIGTWQIDSGRLVRTVRLDPSEIALSTVRLNVATRRFAARSQEGEFLIGDLDTGETRALPFREVMSFTWSPSGEQLLFGSDKMRIWNGVDCRILSEKPYAYAAWSPTGDRVVLANTNVIALHDAATGALLRTVTIDDTCQSVAFSPDGQSIAVGCFYRSVLELDANSLAIKADLAGHEDIVWQVAWTEGGRLISASNDLSVRVWQPSAGLADAVFMAGVQQQSWSPASGEPLPLGMAKAAALPFDSGIVAVGDRILVLPIADPTVLKGHNTYVYRLAFSPDGSMLASSAFQQSEVRVWDVHQGKLYRRLASTASTPITADAPVIAFSADGRRLVASGGAGVANWDIESRAIVPNRSVSEDEQEAFYEELGQRRSDLFTTAGYAVSQDGQWCAIPRGAEVQICRRTTAASGEHQQTLHRGQFEDRPEFSLVGHVGTVYCVAFSPDGSRIATGGNDTTVTIWDAQTGERLLVLHGHELYVMGLAWSPDGRLLASASGDTTIRLWDSLTLQERRAIGRR